MSTTTLTEHTVTVAGKPIFVAEAGSGAPGAASHFAVTRATRSPHREPLGAAWGRSADQHAVAATQPKRDRAGTAPFHEANVKP
jgi:hypothetical protein